ncbi:hypothetical protein [Pseudomonas sp. Hg5Tf]|uniref:Zinc ribbon domain-containing protein n=1 Tax=Pseudomonas sp. Hg7Tf TaxID=3236988 RepID=A0AB39I7X9_9PSED|nr:hypothetical protein [Pseudomonas sp. Hg5Tf]MDH2561693.1 hypothetical protein [Pseudomonas sp. Hg5Tf]
MAVTLCKSCKKTVEPDAKTCPSCGEDYPAVNTAKQLKLIALVAGVLVIGFTLFSDWNSTPIAPVDPLMGDQITGPRSALFVEGSQIVYHQTLGLTPKHYADQLNATLKTLDKPYAVDPANIESGEALDLLNAQLGPFVNLTGSVDKETGQLTSIAILAAGDGSRASGEEIQTVASVAMAAASPGADYSEIHKRFADMVLKEEHYRHGFVEFKAGITQGMGSWFSVNPIAPE